MSDATKDLHDIVRRMGHMRLKFPGKHPTLLAVEIINKLPTEVQDKVVSSAILNGRQFLHEAGNDHHRMAMHQAVIHAVKAIKEVPDKEAKNGISRANPR
ncbi:MAG: hypothetical protein NVSMB39_2200 [Candidatus Saccharimonadales bacterium]